MKRILYRITLLLAAITCAVSITVAVGCDDNNDLEDAGEEVKDALEDAGEEVKDAIEDATE